MKYLNNVNPFHIKGVFCLSLSYLTRMYHHHQNGWRERRESKKECGPKHCYYLSLES